MIHVKSYVDQQWVAPGAHPRQIHSAVTGDVIAQCSSEGIDFAHMVSVARDAGGRALRKLTFHARAECIKALATYLNEHREVLFDLSPASGTTRKDAAIDIDGGISTLFVMASKGRRELPDKHVLLDGEIESLSRTGEFIGQHVYTPRQGVAIHINAFNFPVWGMLEKLSSAILAGMPVIVKPATDTCYITQACFALIIGSECLPAHSVQLIAGSTGDLFDHLGGQDVVSFTGSASTARVLKAHTAFTQHSARFIAEQDSLNASVMGPDVVPGSALYDLWIKEVVNEMTTKAGQKCTAIRRILVPEQHCNAVEQSLTQALSAITVGDPTNERVQMGALVSQAQRASVLANAAVIGEAAVRLYGEPEQLNVLGANADSGAFVPPMLYHCHNPDSADVVHSIEAFGPVATMMAYQSPQHVSELLNRGAGSLVASAFTEDGEFARTLLMETASHHGRLYFANSRTAKSATGHGSPMPHLMHGGPGRAGDGEELGGLRGMNAYMQRTAVQADPQLLTEITEQWSPGARTITEGAHPFRYSLHDLPIGKTFISAPREISLDDIEHFAHFTGDTFYAHMDEAAAKANPFFPGRVAHGYLLIAFAAGLFVDPEPGPVLANYGLEKLRFTKPVEPGDTVHVQLTAKEKTLRNPTYGEVRWSVILTNQNDESVATYELLTMNAT